MEIDNDVISGPAGADDGSAPTTVDPASLTTPSRHSSYGQARNRLAAWVADADDEDDEEIVGEVDDEAAEPVAPANADEDEPTPAPLDDESDEEEAPASSVETPTPEGEAASPAATDKRSGEPKPYAARVGDEEFEIPQGLTLTYKADGREQTRPIEEVLRFAAAGENYDRKSRDLATRQRTLESTFQQQAATLQEQYGSAWQNLLATAQKLAEDADFRDEFLEEYARLQENPQLLQLHQKAARADALEREREQRLQRERTTFERTMWSTVDQIIAEGVATEAYKYADPDEVRNSFQALYAQHGNQALSEDVIRQLMERSHDRVARHLTPVLDQVNQRVAAEKARAAQEAAAKAVVDTRNQITDQALVREKANRRVVTTPATPAPPTPKPIESVKDASRRLSDWANS